MLFRIRYPTDAKWAAAWEKRIKEFDIQYKRKPRDILCSLHFAKQFVKPETWQLTDHAVPTHFPMPQSNPNSLLPVFPSKLVKLSAADGPKSRCCINGCQTQFDKANLQIPSFM